MYYSTTRGLVYKHYVNEPLNLSTFVSYFPQHGIFVIHIVCMSSSIPFIAEEYFITTCILQLAYSFSKQGLSE